MKIREIIVENDEEDMFGQSDRVGNDLRRATYQQRIPSMIKMILGNLEANAGPFIKQMAAELGRDADVFRRDPEIFELADDLLTQEVMPQVSNILLSLDPVTISDEDALNNALTDHVANIRNGSDLWIYIEEILGDGGEDEAYMCAMTIEGEIGALLLKVIQQAYAQPGLSEGEIDEGVNDPHTFKCIFLFGPMGAGKSTVARPLLSHTGLRSVNLDNFNEMFIKKGQVPTGHLAPDQLEKSWQLSQTQQNNFANGRLGVIIDGSGRNPNTAIDVIEKLMPLGYEFMMIFVNVSEATSIARQQSRAAKQQQQWGVGRQVDPTLAKNTYTQVQKNLGRYSAYFGPDRFVYVDNENTPDLTQATKKVDAFLRAPVARPQALAWIQAQKGGQQVAQQQQKLATAQGRQQQALKQYNPMNPKFAKQGMAEGKITLSTDPNWYGATVDNYQASGPVVNIPANQLVGFEPDDKMNQPKSKANVEKIVAGLKKGDKLPPLLVRKYKKGYQVLDGHHRFWAYKLSGTKSIPVQIVPAKDIEEISKQGVAEGAGETLQQQKIRAAISNGLAKSSQMGKTEYQSQPTNRTYFDNAGYASDKLTGIDSIDPDGTVVISIGDTRAADWVKKLAALGGMPGIKTREVQPKLAQGVSEDLSEEFDLIESIVEMIAEHNGVDAEVVWADLESLTEDELYVFAVTSDPLMEDWQKANKRDKTDGMSQKAVNAYRRENPGSKLKTAVTTKPGKLKKGGKASKRRKSYCSRSRGQMKMHSISCAKTPDKAICKARRRWNC